MNRDAGSAAAPSLLSAHLDEDEALLDARDRSMDFGCSAIEPSQGAALRFLATTVRARAVVEVGTGVGVSGLWLLRGMVPEGVLTSIDIEPELHRVARAGFHAAGYANSRLRLINGIALEVLPRLADSSYDLVFIDAVPVEYPKYFVEAIRLLRPGGVAVLAGELDTGPPDNPWLAPEREAALEVLRLATENESLVPLHLALGEGLLAIAKSTP